MDFGVCQHLWGQNGGGASFGFGYALHLQLVLDWLHCNAWRWCVSILIDIVLSRTYIAKEEGSIMVHCRCGSMLVSRTHGWECPICGEMYSQNVLITDNAVPMMPCPKCGAITEWDNGLKISCPHCLHQWEMRNGRVIPYH